MSKYQIDWAEKKTSVNGKDYVKATIKDENDVSTDVSIWPDFAQYAEIKPGATVEGVIQTKGQYKNLVNALRPPSFAGGGKSHVIKEAQQTKATFIAQAQGNKEHGIKISSTIRMAVDCAVAQNDVTPENIEKWRSYFWSVWEKEVDSEAPF